MIEKVGPTKDALDHLGFPSITAVYVLGRGRQRGIAAETSCDLQPELLEQGKAGGLKYVPKRLLSLVVCHDDDLVMQTIIKVKQTGQIGDGKLLICPIDNAVRVRTNEDGEKAVL